MKVNRISQYTDQIEKKKPICESDHKHKQQQKDESEDVKKEIKIIKCGKGEYKNAVFFGMCLSLCDYQCKAIIYRKVLTYMKNRATKHKQHTRYS